MKRDIEEVSRQLGVMTLLTDPELTQLVGLMEDRFSKGQVLITEFKDKIDQYGQVLDKTVETEQFKDRVLLLIKQVIDKKKQDLASIVPGVRLDNLD